MPLTKKRPRSNSDSRRHGSHKLNGNRAVTPSTSTDATSTNNKKITKVTKRIIDEFPSWEKMQMFGPDSIKVVNDGIEIKTKDKLWYKLKNFKDVLELGESENKPDEWVFDFLYGCACEHCATKELAGKNYDKRRRARNFFHMTLGIATQVEDPMGLFIFNLLAVKDYSLTTSTKASLCFQQDVVDRVARELKLALHDNQTSISDDIYVFWLPELFRRMKGFNHTDEVELELPYCAGIQIDSPFVKFGNIKSLLQSDDELLAQFIKPDCLAVTSPFLDRHYKASIPFTISQQVQDRSHEAWRCQKSDGVTKTGISLGLLYEIFSTTWCELHHSVFDQLMKNLVAWKYLKRGETAVCFCSVFSHFKGPIVTPHDHFQIIIPISPKEVKDGEEMVFLGVREDGALKRWPVSWSPKTGYILDSGTFIWPLTAIDYITILFPKY